MNTLHDIRFAFRMLLKRPAFTPEVLIFGVGENQGFSDARVKAPNVTLRRMTTKNATKTHTSSRKKASAASSTKRRAKKITAKGSKRATKTKLTKKKAEELAREKRLKRLMKLTLKAFQMAYEDNQRGLFHRL